MFDFLKPGKADKVLSLIDQMTKKGCCFFFSRNQSGQWSFSRSLSDPRARGRTIRGTGRTFGEAVEDLKRRIDDEY